MYNIEHLEHLNGCEILSVETINYPIISGIIFYLKDKAGKVFALSLERDPDTECTFYIDIANIKQK